MDLTQKELELITKAESSLIWAKTGRIFFFIALLVLISLMVFEYISTETYAYSTVAIILYSVALPHLYGPPYNDLVQLLVKIRRHSTLPSAEVKQATDPLIEALKGKS